MTSTATSSLVVDEDEEMNFTSIFNETNIENYTSPSNNIIDRGDEMSFTMYSILCIKGFIFGSIIIGAVLGNALVILAVRRNRKLRYDYKLFELS